MKLNKDIWKFNNAVKILTAENKEVSQKINQYFNELKNLFLEKNIHLKKVGNFYFNSFKKVNKSYNLDLCAVKYITNSKIKFLEIQEIILQVCKAYKAIPKIHVNKNYINLVFDFKNTKINFRIVPFIVKKLENEIVCTVNRNGIIQEDLVLDLTNDFKRANKLSSGLLVSLKRLINYILNGEFNYSYDIDFLILRWFYEYVSKTLDEFILQRYIKTNQILKIDQFMQLENLQKWIRKNVNFFDMISFIFIKLDSSNTYYFNQFNFETQEIFDGISRYSVNTNSNFKLPTDYLSGIKLFDTDLIEHKNYIQNNISNENGVSAVSWEKFKNDRNRYLVSPIIKSGYANFVMFQKWFTVKSNELYMKLDSDLKTEIKSTKQREAMNALNEIANEWLTKYNLKIKYLQPYFDRKYPFVSNYDVEQLVSLIIQTVDKIDQKQWIIKNDN